MSYPFEKQLGEKPKNFSEHYSDLTDWEQVHSMDDEDIVFDEDTPEILPGDWIGSDVKYKGRAATSEQIDEFRRQLIAYIDRPRNCK